MRRKIGWLTTSAGAAMTAVVVTGVVVAVAAIPGGDGKISACYAESSGSQRGVHFTEGAVRVVDEGEACRSYERPIAWNQVGPTGPTGLAGPAGPTGASGPTGPPGVPYGPPPVEGAVPVPAGINEPPSVLATLAYQSDDGEPHRLLLTGGFNAECDSACRSVRAKATYSVRIDGLDQLARRLPIFEEGDDEALAIVSEIVVTPQTCKPCTVDLVLSATGDPTAGESVVASGVRFGYVDLGPVAD